MKRDDLIIVRGGGDWQLDDSSALGGRASGAGAGD